jgi:hypothetical protein
MTISTRAQAGYASLPVANQSRKSTNSRSQDRASEALIEQLEENEKEFFHGRTTGKTPENDDDEEEESDDEEVNEEAVKEKGATRPVLTTQRAPPTTTRTANEDGSATEKSPFTGLPLMIDVSSNTTTGESTLEDTLEPVQQPVNITDAIATRKAENIYITLAMQMNVFITNGFRKYKALVGKHKTMEGCFMQEFVEVNSCLNVSRTNKLHFLLTTIATQYLNWTKDERLVKRLINMANTCINRKRSFVVDEIKKQALGT